MRQHMLIVSASAAVFAAACGRQSSMDDQMKQDLDAASASTMVMAPNGGGQHVVSAIERVPQTQPRQTKVRKVPTPAQTPPQTAQRTVTGPAATRPSHPPAVNPPPPGGYKTIGEVLRNAPFPIKP